MNCLRYHFVRSATLSKKAFSLKVSESENQTIDASIMHMRNEKFVETPGIHQKF